MSHTFDVVSIGDAKIDIFLLVHDANVRFRLNKETNELCVGSGEKITVDKCAFSLGGNAANVAVGISRLGLKSGIFAEVGSDELSYKIINTLKKENVSIQHLKQTKGQETSISIILNFKNERTIFSEHVQRLHDFNFDNLSTDWIYLTSIGEEWKNVYETVAKFIEHSKTHLAFNPGTLQLAASYNSIAKALSLTDILFLNKEEAITISNIKYQISNIEEILRNLQKLGPKIVVITDSGNGSYAIDEKGGILTQDAIKTKVIEKTGAGDAYSTGFLTAALHGLSIKEAMMWGAVNSANVIERYGAQAGLLTKEQMDSKLKIL
ncbi:carbohydrate kinase family protein [Candidatus Roizmanbacteria bacterium]|nr:carbohydrate kinase family protein [Candidatus Roizmanbacteria bacterium]